jgi:hypothetical protein
LEKSLPVCGRFFSGKDGKVFVHAAEVQQHGGALGGYKRSDGVKQVYVHGIPL